MNQPQGTISEQTISAWADAPMPAYEPLRENLSTDVCVIGAGIAGLTTAYLLAKAGRQTVLLDDRDVAAGQTHRTSAHLSAIIDDRFVEIERVHGVEGARIAHESHRAAIDLIETVVQQENIDCDFARVDGYLFLGTGTPLDELARELSAAERAGVAVERVGSLALSAEFESPALRFPRQAQFHPLRYIAGLAEAYKRLGGRIYGSTRATAISGGKPARVGTDGGQEVQASAVVVATNPPVNDRTVIHTKQAPYTTYVVAIEMAPGSVSPALYWDTIDPYHYVRVHAPDGAAPLLIVGGEDHKTGQATDVDKQQRFQRLTEWAGLTFGARGPVRHRWSGQVMETLDGLGFIGRNPLDHDNVFIITGDSGMGLTHGSLGAIIVRDLINDVANPWAALYDPARKPLATLPTFAEENLNVALQMRDWLTPGELDSTDALRPGEGGILRQGLLKQAVYRDDAGTLHACSAVCPHLGCIVRWNGLEKIWDCPCHGSRFDRYGKVVTGPSRADLKPASLE